MHKYLLNVKLKNLIVYKILFLCILFLSACTAKKSPLDAFDRSKIHSFLNQFLFVEGAAFSLFGDKPLSGMLIFTGDSSDLAELTEEEIKTAQFVDGDELLDEWKIWKRFTKKLPSDHFLFAERPCARDPHHMIYFLVNIERVKEILHKHRLAFHEKTDIQFDFDSDKVIREFQDPQSSFWEKTFSDHYLAGLLFGYGEENIAYFSDMIKKEEKARQFSDQYDASASPARFPIPLFAMSPEDKTSAHYRKQRKAIQNICRDKDILDVTINYLSL